MNDFKASYLEIKPYELVHFLLQETGQYDRDAVNPIDLLNFLKLDYLSFDFDTELPPEAQRDSRKPRALLSFSDRLVAVDENLKSTNRIRFSILHETAHYILPAHQCSMYLCDTTGMSPRSKLDFEKEANECAASLLFKGAVFATEAAQMPVSVKSIVDMATIYEASFEATARRFVEKNLKPIMLVVFSKADNVNQADLDAESVWKVKYCIPSPTFRTRFFSKVTGQAPATIGKKLATPFGNIMDTEMVNLTISGGEGQSFPCQAEFFYNRYNIMCLLTPATS